MIELIIDKRIHDLGGGFEVGRVLPFTKRRMVGPFVFFDHIGPVFLPAGIDRKLDVRPHPHIGLSTVSYLYDGGMTHRDSVGSVQEIHPGEVNWMVAGSGITHSERFERARAVGARLHGIQAWVALPREAEETAPAFYHHSGPDAVPEWQGAGVRGRLIAGELFGLRAAVQTHSPLFYVHWEMEPAATAILPDTYSERAIYVAAGQIEIHGQSLLAGQLAILKNGQATSFVARQPATVMGLGGEPVGERFLFWNFVASSRERLEQAKEDWRQQRMKLPDFDNDEFIPLPP